MTQAVILAIIFIIDGAIWILTAVPVMIHVLRHHKLPFFLGIRSFSGPFSEALGIDMMVPLLLTFVMVNSFKFLAAYWLSQMRTQGAVLGLILIGVGSIYWYGFLIPGGPVFGIPEFILIVILWSRLG